MGWADRSFIENAAKYLLSTLQAREFVDYSEFYDGTDETAERLRQAVEGDDDGDSQSPELMLDLAVDQLEGQGIVEREWLDSQLADGEQNYRISWAKGGRQKAEATALSFHDVEL